MKILGLNVPPELADKFAQYITSLAPDLLGKLIARQRKGSRRARIWKPRITENQKLQFCAEYIADLLAYPAGTNWRKTFITAEKKRLRAGILSPEYWQPCEVLSDEFFDSEPINTPASNPPAYAYRSASFWPANTTYGPGLPSVGPTRTEGAVTGQQWADSLWVWRRILCRLPGQYQPSTLPPIAMLANGTMTVETTRRGSRPMFSALYRAHIIDPTSPLIDDLAAPCKPARSIYWRYKVPKTPPPYYTAQLPRRALKILNYEATKDDLPTLNRTLVKFGARPMLGKGFNNCEQVSTRFDGTITIYTAALKLYYGLMISNWFFKPSGAIEHNTGQIDTSEIFRDPQTSVRTIENEGINYRVHIRTDLSTHNEFAAHWALGEWAGKTSTLKWIQPSLEGWIVARRVQGEAFDTYWEFDESGLYIESWTDTIYPTAPNIKPGSYNPVVFCRALNIYALNSYDINGIPAIICYDKHGIISWSFNYETIGCDLLHSCYHHPDGLLTVARLNQEEPYIQHIYLHTGPTPTLIAPFVDDNNDHWAISFSQGLIYLFGSNPAFPYWTLSEDYIWNEIPRDPIYQPAPLGVSPQPWVYKL